MAHNLFLFSFFFFFHHLILLQPVSEGQISSKYVFNVVYSSSGEYFSSFYMIQFKSKAKLETEGQLQVSPLRSVLPERFLSPLCCSAFLLLTLKYLLAHPFAPWPPPRYCTFCASFTPWWTLHLWALLLLLAELWHRGNRMEIGLGWPHGMKCVGNVAGECILWCPSKKTYMVLFKIKIWEAKLIKSQTGMKGRISNHDIVKNLSSRNLHWNHSCLGGWSTAQTWDSSSWLLPVYTQHLCSAAGEKHSGRCVCALEQQMGGNEELFSV